VAAAILRDGHVLAARRTLPPQAAGRWELPGGKVEDGEGPDAALVREIGEELGCLVEVGEWLAGESPIGETHVLRAALCRVIAGEPRPREHDEVRWLAADELDTVDWLEPDRPFLAELAGHLAGAVATVRAVLFEEEHATAVADGLAAEGWWVSVRRERLHGDDDDEDPQWVVETDAPAVVLELLAEEHDGWVDAGGSDEPAGPVYAPEPLPGAPRRIKRPE